MKRPLVTTVLAVLAAVALAGGGLYYLAGSAAGTQWLSKKITALSDGALEWEQVEGTFLRSLRIHGLRLRLPGTALDIEKVTLAWSPARLLSRTVQVDHVAATGIDIVLSDTGDADPPAEPFNPAALDLPFDVVLEALELRDIGVSVDGAPPQRVDAVDLAGRLQDQQLTVQEIRLRAADGGLSGNGAMGLVAAMPLRLDVQWEWRLFEQLLGGHLQAAGDASLVEIEYAGRGAVPVHLRGTVLAILTNPGWELALDWPDFAVSVDQTTLVVGSGRIHSEGDLDQYRLASEGELTYEEMDTVAWSMSGTGTRKDLQLQPLQLISGPYQLALSGSVGWSEPLAAQLDYRATMESLALLNPDLPERLDAVGVLAARFESDTLDLEQFDLALEQAELRLSLAGSAVLPEGADPLIDANLQWQDLQWPIAGPLAEALINSSQGTAALAGTFDAWNLKLDTHLSGEQLPPGQWIGRANGNRRELQLESLRGTVLDGAVALNGVVGWDPVPAWQLRASGQSLDPGSWQPAFPGLLAFDFISQGDVRDETGPQATFELGQLSGEFAGVPLAAQGNGSILGDLVQLETISLSSGNNALSASGQIDSQRLGLDWTMRAPDPGLLLHGAGGSLEGRGRVEGSLEQPVLHATLVGSDLRYEDLFLSRLGLSLQGGAAAQAPLQLDFELGPLQQGAQTLLDSARLSGTGTTAKQQLTVEVQAESAQLRTLLEGGLDATFSSWRGQLAALGFDGTGFGRWALARPAALEVGAAGAELERSCLQKELEASAARPARACVAGSWSTESGSRISLDLRSFDLARWLPEVSGELNGELAGALAPDGALTARAVVDVSAGELGVASGQASQPMRHGGGMLDIRVGPEGLLTTLDFEPLQDGRLSAELALPQLNRLPAAGVQPLSGRIRAQLPDLGGLQGWVPQLEAVVGRLDSDFKLAGDLRQPGVTGELTLTDGAAEVPAAGLRLQDIQLRLHDDPARPGQLLLTGGLRSGEGALELDGRMLPLDSDLSLSVKGESVKVFDTPDAKVKVSPDLDLVWSDELLTLRGQLVVPEAKITPRLALGRGSSSGAAAEAADGSAPGPEQIIAPSADVIVLGLQEEVAAPAEDLPFRLNAEVALVLGEKVSINALGLAGNLAGKVTFRNQAQLNAGPPIADGSLSIENGSFRAFGQDLEIETGRIIYRNTPVTEPEVNLRAVRWIDNDPLVSVAGVQVNGPLTDPVLELFSRPQLDPTEIQSYLLTGHSSSGGDSVLSIGTYLYPKLYVGYGYNLLEETSEFSSLYTITPRYGVDTSVGEADNSIGVTITYEH